MSAVNDAIYNNVPICTNIMQCEIWHPWKDILFFSHVGTTIYEIITMQWQPNHKLVIKICHVHNLHFKLGTAFEYVILSICHIDCIIWAFSEYFRSLVNHASLIFEDNLKWENVRNVRCLNNFNVKGRRLYVMGIFFPFFW